MLVLTHALKPSSRIRMGCSYAFFNPHCPVGSLSLSGLRCISQQRICPLSSRSCFRHPVGRLSFPNRVFVSPMCQYSSEDGFSNDWHLVPFGEPGRQAARAGVYGSGGGSSRRADHAPGPGTVERRSHRRTQRIVNFLHGQGVRAGAQLAHAGRKASMTLPWAKEQRI